MNRPQFAMRPHAAAAALILAAGIGVAPVATAVNYPVTPQQRSTAQQVSQAGVPLSELAPNAPDSYTVKRGDTLWDISKLFLRSPWRWPELWGMNLDQIRNPHLIYPGQLLVLEKNGDRARLRVGGSSTGTDKLSPRIRGEDLTDAIASIPMGIIGPFLTDGTVLNANELEQAPRVVAAPEGRVMMGVGDNAYVRGELGNQLDWRLYRQATPMVDPDTRAVLGYEARFVGAARYTREGGSAATADGKPNLPVPATVRVMSAREEVTVGDRLAQAPQTDFRSFVPRAPTQAVNGRIVSVYGDSLMAGQNQVVAINRGTREGMERGHVLALLKDGERARDTTYGGRAQDIKLPDEQHGMLFVFRVFERVSYALVLQSQHPVRAGDRFMQP
jgi:nucleoid-associated protein YgaU